MLTPIDARPVIRVEPGEMLAVTNAAAATLSNLKVFRNGNGLVVPHFRKFNGKVDLVLKEVSRTQLFILLEQAAVWERFNEKRQCWIACSPPSYLGAPIYEIDDSPIARIERFKWYSIVGRPEL
jgi:hypothetical protein